MSSYIFDPGQVTGSGELPGHRSRIGVNSVRPAIIDTGANPHPINPLSFLSDCNLTLREN